MSVFVKERVDLEEDEVEIMHVDQSYVTCYTFTSP